MEVGVSVCAATEIFHSDSGSGQERLDERHRIGSPPLQWLIAGGHLEDSVALARASAPGQAHISDGPGSGADGGQIEERLVQDPEPATCPGGPVHSARLRVEYEVVAS